MLRRMLGAARLNVDVYEEVEADRSATFQAFFVVVLVAVATGVGSLSAGGVVGLIGGILFAIIAWGVWAFITFFIGTTLFRTPETEADWGQLLRTTGFAQTPGILRIFAFIPLIGPGIFFAMSIWQLVAMVVAVRQALDYNSTFRAVGVVIVGFVVVLVIQILIRVLFF